MKYDQFWKTLSQEDIKSVLKQFKDAKSQIEQSKGTAAYKALGSSFESLFEDLAEAFKEATDELESKVSKDTERAKGFSEKTGKIEIALAGYSQKDISVSLEGEILTVTNTNPAKATKNLKYRIPGEIERLDMKMSDGLLVVEVIRPSKTNAIINWK